MDDCVCINYNEGTVTGNPINQTFMFLQIRNQYLNQRLNLTNWNKRNDEQDDRDYIKEEAHVKQLQ